MWITALNPTCCIYKSTEITHCQFSEGHFVVTNAALSSDRRQQKSKLGLIIPPEKEKGQLGELTILCITVTVVWMGEW